MSEEELKDVASVGDEYASIREHVESGVELTDDEMDTIADLAVGYLKGILSLFGENSSSIDEYDGENGELILDVNGGGPCCAHRPSRSYARCPADDSDLSDEQQPQVLLSHRR